MVDNAILQSGRGAAQRGSWYPRISLSATIPTSARLCIQQDHCNVSFGVVLNWNYSRAAYAVVAAEAEFQSALQSRQSLLLEIESELWQLAGLGPSRRQQVL